MINVDVFFLFYLTDLHTPLPLRAITLYRISNQSLNINWCILPTKLRKEVEMITKSEDVGLRLYFAPTPPAALRNWHSYLEKYAESVKEVSLDNCMIQWYSRVKTNNGITAIVQDDGCDCTEMFVMLPLSVFDNEGLKGVISSLIAIKLLPLTGYSSLSLFLKQRMFIPGLSSPQTRIFKLSGLVADLQPLLALIRMKTIGCLRHLCQDASLGTSCLSTIFVGADVPQLLQAPVLDQRPRIRFPWSSFNDNDINGNQQWF